MTEKQRSYILEHYLTQNAQEISKILNIKPHQVLHFLRKNDLIKEYKTICLNEAVFSEEDIYFMKNNYLKMTYKEIGDILGFSERQIRGKINNMGLTKNRKIKSDYFNIIDNPLKAYFLGYIYADGWIHCDETHNNNEFGMELQYRDKYILEKLNEELGGLNNIRIDEAKDMMIVGKLCHKSASAILRVYSKELVKGLHKNEIEYNKTLKETCPVVSDELFFDFLRGYIDGDGCFYTDENNHTIMHITCATSVPLKYIQKKLEQYGINTRVRKETERKYRLWCSNKNDMIELVNYIYYKKDLFCLSRKMEKIKHLLCLSSQKCEEKSLENR